LNVSVSRGAGIIGPAIEVAGVSIGAGHPLQVIAGPCSVESYDQFRATAIGVQQAGATLLRGGAFKPRSSPYSFQGLGEEGLEIMRAVADELGMGVVTEAMAPEDVGLIDRLADMAQVGARNMNNRPLLKALAESGMPILLKRGFASTVDEVLEAAEYILTHGNTEVAICERGSRTFEPSMRNSLDVAAIPEMRLRSDLPVVVDPSHGTGRTDLVLPAALAGVAAGADAMIVEVHPDPSTALSDGYQSIELHNFGEFMAAVKDMAAAVGRSF
jgi:3-deoxy-7-phosphoheptulonate synthase